jgi:voltage-gated potassium channel
MGRGGNTLSDSGTTQAERQARLLRWDRRMTPIIVVAAILPLAGIFADDPTAGLGPWVDVASWLVFLVDLVVHVRLADRYLSTGAGRFDVGIVVLTFPWFLVIPGLADSNVLLLARLARVGRIAAVAWRGASGLQRLGSRIGKAAAYAGAITFVCALIEHHVEGPASGFETIGDSLWWAVVTITTVGYGDMVPQTGIGRVTAAVLMIAGLAFLGAVAGSLASFLGLGNEQEEGSDDDGTVLREVRELREQISRLEAASQDDE